MKILRGVIIGLAFGVILRLAFAHTLGAPQDLEVGISAYRDGNYALALERFVPLAESGDASAQFNLGVMYSNGQGVAQDYAEAMNWYRLAAEQGDAPAQRRLGYMYSNGRVVAQDYAESAKWSRLAAEQGDTIAQYNLATMYHNGQGVVQDYAEAVNWYRLAAEQGDARAQNNLGYMYSEGQRQNESCCAEFLEHENNSFSTLRRGRCALSVELGEGTTECLI